MHPHNRPGSQIPSDMEDSVRNRTVDGCVSATHSPTYGYCRWDRTIWISCRWRDWMPEEQTKPICHGSGRETTASMPTILAADLAPLCAHTLHGAWDVPAWASSCCFTNLGAREDNYRCSVSRFLQTSQALLAPSMYCTWVRLVATPNLPFGPLALNISQSSRGLKEAQQLSPPRISPKLKTGHSQMSKVMAAESNSYCTVRVPANVSPWLSSRKGSVSVW